MPTEQRQLDAIDRRLLEELQADARLTLAELGRRVGLSSPAVAERLQRLEAAARSAATTPKSTRARSATR